MVNQMRKLRRMYERKPRREVPARERQAINSWQTELCFILFYRLDQTPIKDINGHCELKTVFQLILPTDYHPIILIW